MFCFLHYNYLSEVKRLYSAVIVLFPSDEIIMHEGVTAVYKVNVDLFFAVLGAQNENEVHFNIHVRLRSSVSICNIKYIYPPCS